MDRDYFTFQVGHILTFAIPSGVMEMWIDPNKDLAEPPAGSSSVVVGVLEQSDGDITIVDLRRLFGVEEDTSARPGWLVLKYAGRSYGFVVDGFDEPVHLSQEIDPELVEMDFPLPQAIPYLIGVIPPYRTGLAGVIYPLDLGRILAPETLLVN